LAELAAHADSMVRRAAARNGALPEESLVRLLDDDSWEVRTIAAHHKRAPKDRTENILRSLAEAPDAGKRSVSARSPHMPVDVLLKLLTDSDAETRSNAAKNPRTPRRRRASG
jgi:hypothetical protein